MEQPKIAGNAPIAIELEAGKTYAWCTCGQSSKQPLCDGKHRGSAFTPLVFKAEESKTVYLCTCKQTNQPGFCDGSHKALQPGDITYK
ncbi:MAG: CDGSH iron-sulfur domain-containing protein [Bacteroidota bacterium]